MVIKKYNRRAKRAPVKQTGPVDSPVDIAGSTGDQNVKLQSSVPQTAMLKNANQKKQNIQEVEKKGASDGLSCFPHKPRTKRKVCGKNATTRLQNADLHEEQITENISSQQLVPAHQNARQRRKRRRKDEGTVEEIVSISLGREQLRRGLRCEKGITPWQGKLDTNTFECYFKHLWMQFKEEKTDSFAYLDCLWFSLYTKEPSKAKVLNWIKKKQIFSKRYVFIPIVRWQHWSLLIFCHFGECVESKSRSPCMLLLDSLQMMDPRRLEPGIRKFVLDIYKAEDRPENKEEIYRIPLLVPKVPQQRNDEECGKYVLYYLNLFLESAPENFSISDGYPYFLKEDWFTPEGLECFCKGLDSSCVNSIVA